MKKLLFCFAATFVAIYLIAHKMQSLIKFIKMNDPSVSSTAEVLLYQGLWARLIHYPAHFFYKKRQFFLARAISQFSRAVTGIEIHPGAKLSHTVFIDHGAGVVFGETSEIGENVIVYQGVTLGGTGKENGPKRHPTIGNNVMLGANSVILGPVTIGDNSKIGALSIVLHDVKAGSTIVGKKGQPKNLQDKV